MYRRHRPLAPALLALVCWAAGPAAAWDDPVGRLGRYDGSAFAELLEVAAFRDQTQVTFPLVWDSGSYDDFDWPPAMSPFPRQVLLGRDGRVRYLATEHDHRALAEAIDAALAGAPK